MASSSPISAHVLLEHESFVRAVVRGVLSDEHGVQDVVQETWLRALRRPPREGTSIRAWLGRVAKNVARDRVRTGARRRAREERAARPEQLESVASVHERLSSQQTVVGCVLALEEPYRGVVLLRYYEGLSAAEIGSRLDRSAATVRSQLTRAHERLRSSLDRSFEGDRKAWAGLVAVPFVRPGLGKPAMLAAGVAAVATVVAVAVWPSSPVERTPLSPGERPGEVAAASVAAPLAESAGREAVPSSSRSEVARERPAGAAGEELEDLDDLSVEELVALAVQIQREVERQVFAPAQEHLDAYAHYAGRDDAGVDRILHGEGSSADLARGLMVRGGGTYFSFPSRTHDYNHAPDLTFRQRRFGSGFAGIDLGLMMELGDVALDDLPEAAYPIPVQLSEEGAADWMLLWSEITLEDHQHGSVFRKEVPERLSRDRAQGLPGKTYLVRSCQPDEHDVLVAFRPLAYDGKGCTFAWRMLGEWPAHTPSSAYRTNRYEHVPPGPVELRDMEVPELLALLDRVRERGRELLLTVPREQQADYVTLLAEPRSSGFARILVRSRYEPLFAERGGGAYYSFVTKENSFDGRPDLGLELEDALVVEDGLLLDVGPLELADLEQLVSELVPVGLDLGTARAITFMQTVRAVRGDDGRLALAMEDDEHRRRLRITSTARPRVGHSYVLRSATNEYHDHLVVFTVIGGDEHGYALAWWVVRTYAPVR